MNPGVVIAVISLLAHCPKSALLKQVYKATVTSGGNVVAVYHGLTEGTFKQRHSGHKSDFKPTGKKNSTALSKFIHEERDAGRETKVTWSITKKAQKYRTGARKCDLCLTEKLVILKCNEV